MIEVDTRKSNMPIQLSRPENIPLLVVTADSGVATTVEDGA